MTIGERIKTVRKHRGLTQKALGAVSGTSEITIRQYELGKRQPRVQQLQAIANALDVSTDYLIGEHHLKSAIDVNSSFILNRIFKGIRESGFSNEEFCLRLNLPIDEWFKWKEVSSESYLECLPEISKLLNIPESDLLTPSPFSPDWKKRIIAAFERLNDEGRVTLLHFAEDLLKNPNYQYGFVPNTKQSVLMSCGNKLGGNLSVTVNQASTDKAEENKPSGDGAP